MIGRVIIWIIFLIGGIVAGFWLDWHWFRSCIINPWWHVLSMIAGVGLFMMVMRVSRNTGRYLARYGKEGELRRNGN